ncbi:MAG: glucose-6-phosphate isomerase, partial [Calditrichaeota bacterium]|nr:glucose-6-phosphate isomerase [Calditrichota bacterium]
MSEKVVLKDLGAYAEAVDRALSDLQTNRVVERIWRHDHTVWKPEPTEITNRLGWLEIVDEMQPKLDELRAFVDEVREAGYTHVLLLGMGGSSLAPEVFRKVFGVAPDHLDLAVLDSTDPGAVKAWAERLDPQRTLFLVSTKSGTTVETLSFFKFFYTWVTEALGRDKAGQHFVAITDPGSPLVATAEKYGFRRVFLNNPNIGGRYSALSYFGLVPAALVGVDLEGLLDRARQAMADSAPSVPAAENPAARLGVVMGQLALLGRDKLTFVLPAGIASFGDWLEQLIAESTGKEGKGILPVVGEPLGDPSVYG